MLSVSPLTTGRLVPKSPPPYNVPVVPPLVLLSVRKQPNTVEVALILKTALAAELSTLPAEILPGVYAGLVASLYGVMSDQPACEPIVSAATILPVPFNPTNHAGEANPLLIVASSSLFNPAVTTIFLNFSVQRKTGFFNLPTIFPLTS